MIGVPFRHRTIGTRSDLGPQAAELWQERNLPIPSCHFPCLFITQHSFDSRLPQDMSVCTRPGGSADEHVVASLDGSPAVASKSWKPNKGEKLDALDSKGQWWPATVLDVRFELPQTATSGVRVASSVLVRFDTWSDGNNEWIPLRKGRLEPHRSRTWGSGGWPKAMFSPDLVRRWSCAACRDVVRDACILPCSCAALLCRNCARGRASVTPKGPILPGSARFVLRRVTCPSCREGCLYDLTAGSDNGINGAISRLCNLPCPLGCEKRMCVGDLVVHWPVCPRNRHLVVVTGANRDSTDLNDPDDSSDATIPFSIPPSPRSLPSVTMCSVSSTRSITPSPSVPIAFAFPVATRVEQCPVVASVSVRPSSTDAGIVSEGDDEWVKV